MMTQAFWHRTYERGSKNSDHQISNGKVWHCKQSSEKSRYTQIKVQDFCFLLHFICFFLNQRRSTTSSVKAKKAVFLNYLKQIG